MDLFAPAINRLLDAWLDEDLGRGDLTTNSLLKQTSTAQWIAKQPGIFCGGMLVERLFHKLDPSVNVKQLVNEGESFQDGQSLIDLQGPTTALLAGERSALNVVMHLSGIATATAKLVKELEGTGIGLADTRKTTPGLRVLEKYAVRCGGGINHRLGLDDAAMLKENHLMCTNNIDQAIKSIRASAPWTTKIIVESETSQQAHEAVLAGADGILLDEMSVDEIKELVPKLRKLASSEISNRASSQIVIEASGINPKKIKDYADSGVDLISSSAPITRSAWIDLSMRFS